jgi:tetratricopeptide (TPR) repeat protein
MPIEREKLTKRLTDDARYVEAGVFIGRVRSTRPGAKEVADARVWLNGAVAKWPRSSAVLYALGTLNQTVGDCRAAVTWYDKTLAEYGEHEDAHLGRLMCLSYLRRHAEAIDEASGMIFRKITVGEAYYWRAWNYRETNDLPKARADSDRAKSLLFNDRVMTLAGQIEHDQDDLDIAEKDLTEAVRVSHGENCVAAWYYSLVQLKKKAWEPTANGFVGAMNCYEGDKAKTIGYREDMKAAENVDEDYRKAQLANFDAVIAEDDSQISASAFNAAVNFARGQNREKALQYCDLAARDPARAAAVEELRKLIVK